MVGTSLTLLCPPYKSSSPAKAGSLRPVRRHKHPRRAVHHLFGALGGRGGGDLEHERQEQRGLAHLDELRRGELAIVDREIAGFYMNGEIVGEAAAGLLQDKVLEPAAAL